MTETETFRCVTCNEPIEIPKERATDGPFKHEGCQPPNGH